MNLDVESPRINTARFSVPMQTRTTDGSLLLRQYGIHDAEDIFDLIDRNRDYLTQHGEVTGLKYRTADCVTESILHPDNPARLRFTIRDHSGVLVGGINLTPQERNDRRGEVGYFVGAEFSGKGIATRAVKTLSTFAFDHLHFSELFGSVDESNHASKRVLEKAGYQEIKRFLKDDQKLIELARMARCTL